MQLTDSPQDRFVNASGSGNVPLMQKCLEEGASVNSPSTNGGMTGLMYAAAEGEVDAIDWLLSHGADWRSRDKTSGRTPMIYAAAKGRLAVIEKLIEYGASLNTRDADGETALMYGVIGGHSDMSTWLRQQGAHLTDTDSFRLVQYAAGTGNVPALGWLKLHLKPEMLHRSLHAADDSGDTPLIQAASIGSSEMGEWIMAHTGSTTTTKSAGLIGDDSNHLDVQNNLGLTALMSAALHGYSKMVSWLLEAGASPNLQNSNGWTALMYAAEGGHIDTVSALIDGGAAVTADVAMRAREGGHDDVAVLIEAAILYKMKSKHGHDANSPKLVYNEPLRLPKVLDNVKYDDDDF